MGKFRDRSIISIRDFDKEEIEHIINKALEIKQGAFRMAMEGKILATLFFEPSTRTRLSFESAMVGMGGKVIGFADPGHTSVKKGESITDTIKTVTGYCDVIAIRHFVEGAARLASEIADVPVINAGDGANQHPTQTFLDLMTMHEELGTLEGLKVGMVGDLKYGRTVHSLSHALCLFGADLTFISPLSLRIPKDLLENLESMGCKYSEHQQLGDIQDSLDVLYVTRIQKERFGDFQEYERVAGSYRITTQTLDKLGPDTKIMHPLPRVDEIDPCVDSDPRALYFKQAHNGVPTRQAVLGLVTGAIE
ncbi:MAG: aspartate carbamoyltransferase [Deltaproteobacteria bacterium]|nr:aspartate carbamoyltransferase [Deltaproteobacteria bacterium]